MTVKEVKSINFLFFRTKTTVDKLVDLIPVGQQLYREAVKNEWPITGPVHWHYYNFAPDPAVPFDIEVALPVGEAPLEYDGPFHVKRTEPFKCVSAVHEGNWLTIPDTYNRIIEFVKTRNLVPTSANREVYVNVDFRNEDANVTEIQFGVQ